MRFDGGEQRDDGLEEQADHAANAWYLYVPPVMAGVWLVVAVARIVALLLEPADVFAADPSAAHEGIDLAVTVVDWIGGLGWVSLFACYLVLLSRRRAPAWWLLGAFCFGPNLPLYIALLVVPRRRSVVGVESSRPSLWDAGKLRRPAAFAPTGSFVCESCSSLLNYGASECRKCGCRYEYAEED